MCLPLVMGEANYPQKTRLPKHNGPQNLVGFQLGGDVPTLSVLFVVDDRATGPLGVFRSTSAVSTVFGLTPGLFAIWSMSVFVTQPFFLNKVRRASLDDPRRFVGLEASFFKVSSSSALLALAIGFNPPSSTIFVMISVLVILFLLSELNPHVICEFSFTIYP